MILGDLAQKKIFVFILWWTDDHVAITMGNKLYGFWPKYLLLLQIKVDSGSVSMQIQYVCTMNSIMI